MVNKGQNQLELDRFRDLMFVHYILQLEEANKKVEAGGRKRKRKVEAGGLCCFDYPIRLTISPSYNHSLLQPLAHLRSSMDEIST